MQLHKKNIPIPLNCENCQCLSKDAIHLFFNCPFTLHHIQKQDSAIKTILNTIPTDNLSLKQILLHLNSKLSKQQIITLATTWWAIWMLRNQTLFQTNNENRIRDLYKFILDLRLNWKKTKYLNRDDLIKTRLKKLGSQRKTKNICWSKPKRQHFKVNFDGAVDKHGNATMGYIIRDSQGSLIYMDNASGSHLSVLQSEALALKMTKKKLTKYALTNFQSLYDCEDLTKKNISYI